MGVKGLGEKRGMCNAVPVMSPVLDSVEIQIHVTDTTDQPEKILGLAEEEYAPFTRTDE